MVAGVNGYAAVGDVTTNVGIDFSNPIADGKVLGSSGEMSIQPNGDCPTEINAEGRLVLGKGDETYQIIGEQTLPFDDREIIRSLLAGAGFTRS